MYPADRRDTPAQSVFILEVQARDVATPGTRLDGDTERKGTTMMSDLAILTISVAVNIAMIMLAILLRDT